ncbi:DUF4352 domain-containing protein [Candidatus Microgenomates bacterium]|nr:MAG: DUF4352 domain-containing protein [Candidatus Microgenomates bacterium]
MLSGSGTSKPERVGNSGTTDEARETSAPKTEIFALGDTVNLDGKAVTVNEVKSYASKNQFLAPKQGNKFVAVDVTLKNNGDEAYSYNVLEFSLQDNKDYSYTNAATDIEPYITVGAIQPGQSVRGFIAFEIPKENEPVKIVYTPDFWGTSQVIIELK